MDYRYLKSFLAVAQTGNFSRAAKQLHIAQSAVSRQIKLLEESLGKQLLLRTTHTVTLTALGQELFEKASQFEHWSNDTFNRKTVTIRMGVLPGLMDDYLMPKLVGFKADRNMNYVIRIDSPAVLANMLLKNELDACLTYNEIHGEQIASQRLFTESIGIISAQPIDLKQLETYRWIHMGNAIYLKKISKQDAPQFIIVNSMSTLLALVEAGKGIAAVPDYIYAKKSKLKVYPTKFKDTIYLNHWQYDIWPKPLSELLEMFGK